MDSRGVPMSRISVPVTAYILSLLPQLGRRNRDSNLAEGEGGGLEPLARGLAVPSFWSRWEISDAFVEANRIWSREADIEFSPVNITERSEAVPADDRAMWARFVSRLKPEGRGIGVGFVYDLPASEGGWGGGRVAVISGQKARSGLRNFPGNLLAHELGHVLINDPLHELAGDDPSNLMHKNRHPRVANAGMLNAEQVRMARERAASL